jgi:MraZ protein
MTFRGSFEHTIDDRGRVAIPAKYRSEFKNNVAVVTPAVEGCLRIFPEATYDELSRETAATPATILAGRRSRRLFHGLSWDVELDRQGRILIPARLRQMAGLNGAVIVAGNLECLEIWSPDLWEREVEAAREALSADQRSEE